MGSTCRSLSQACVPPVIALCVTGMAPAHWLPMGLWRASLAVGQCPSASLVGHSAGTWGQGAPWNAGSMHSHQEPGGSLLSLPAWGMPCGTLLGPGGGSLCLGLRWRWSWRERKLSTQSQKFGPCPSRESISSRHQHVMACHDHISPFIIFLFTWNKGIDVPQCLPGDSTVPPAEGLDPVGVRMRLQQAVESCPAHG